MKATASKRSATLARSASVPHRRDELEVDELVPDVEGGDEEVVDRRRCPVACSRSLACEPPFSPVTSTSVIAVASGYGKMAVHLAHEVAAQRDQEEDAQAAAGQADEDRLHRVRVELQDVERRQGEDGARHDARPRRRRCR